MLSICGSQCLPGLWKIPEQGAGPDESSPWRFMEVSAMVMPVLVSAEGGGFLQEQKDRLVEAREGLRGVLLQRLL